MCFSSQGLALQDYVWVGILQYNTKSQDMLHCLYGIPSDQWKPYFAHAFFKINFSFANEIGMLISFWIKYAVYCKEMESKRTSRVFSQASCINIYNVDNSPQFLRFILYIHQWAHFNVIVLLGGWSRNHQNHDMRFLKQWHCILPTFPSLAFCVEYT